MSFLFDLIFFFFFYQQLLSTLTEEYIQASILAVGGDTTFLPDTSALMEVLPSLFIFYLDIVVYYISQERKKGKSID